MFERTPHKTPRPYEAAALQRDTGRRNRYDPTNCPHCEYDRKFPETKNGGWIYPGNNAAIVPCGVCNPDGKFPRT